MKVLVTGAKGFIGQNLCIELKNKHIEVLEFDQNNSLGELFSFVKIADFVVHLAGVNRPLTVDEFYDGNANFTYQLIETIRSSGKKIPLIFSSSIQASLSNDYGKSKKMAEDYLMDFSKNSNNPVYIYRLSNVFGKWARPNYNSVIGTFCYNISHGININISNPENEVPFVYIDDIVEDFLSIITSTKADSQTILHEVRPIYKVTLGQLVDLLYSFKKSREDLSVPNTSGDFESKLYSTYLSYLSPNNFSYQLQMHADDRGAFTEFLRTKDAGQVSINLTKPGITKGNHWHHSKSEKFLVVSGEASIKFRKVGEDTVIEYFVEGTNLKVVDIPCGYTHSITNIGNKDLITVMWASESFNPDKPDTYFMEVIKK